MWYSDPSLPRVLMPFPPPPSFLPNHDSSQNAHSHHIAHRRAGLTLHAHLPQLASLPARLTFCLMLQARIVEDDADVGDGSTAPEGAGSRDGSGAEGVETLPEPQLKQAPPSKKVLVR